MSAAAPVNASYRWAGFDGGRDQAGPAHRPGGDQRSRPCVTTGKGASLSRQGKCARSRWRPLTRHSSSDTRGTEDVSARVVAFKLGVTPRTLAVVWFVRKCPDSVKRLESLAASAWRGGGQERTALMLRSSSRRIKAAAGPVYTSPSESPPEGGPFRSAPLSRTNPPPGPSPSAPRQPPRSGNLRRSARWQPSSSMHTARVVT